MNVRIVTYHHYHLVCSGIILRMRPANERWRSIVTSSLIGRVHKQNDPDITCH